MWPQWDSQENSLIIDTTLTPVNHLLTSTCQLWDSIGYDFE